MTDDRRRNLPTLYVSGRMAGMPDNNYPAFHDAADRLRDAGYLVENPAELGDVDGWTWSDYMRRGLVQMLKCDAVATLPQWTWSTGARLEVDVAAHLGMKVMPVEDWLKIMEDDDE